MIMMRIYLLPYLVILYLIVIALRIIPTASSTSGSSNYESVRALDQSGRSRQLQNALAAATHRGRLVIAIQETKENNSSCTESSSKLYILSTKTPADSNSYYHHLRPNTKFGDRSHLLQRIIVPASSHSSSAIYVICSGVQADARYMIQELQLYCRLVWERYGSTHHPGWAVAAAVAALKRRRFWGYNEELAEPAGSIDYNSRGGSDRSSSTWGRPFGIQTMIISKVINRMGYRYGATSSLSSQHDEGRQHKFELYVVDPSGTSRSFVDVACIGRNCEEIQTKLEEYIRTNSRLGLWDETSIFEKVKSALASTLGSSPTEMTLEVISSEDDSQITRGTLSLT